MNRMLPGPLPLSGRECQGLVLGRGRVARVLSWVIRSMAFDNCLVGPLVTPPLPLPHRLVGRLSEQNPACVNPGLRRHLLQLLTDIEHSPDIKHKEGE